MGTVDSELLIDRAALRRLDEHIKARVDAREIPGAVISIWRFGELAHSCSIGWRDVERQVAATDDTIYRAFSMTKPIASVALMQRFERGDFQLNDPVHEFIPAWRDLQVSLGRTGIGMPNLVPCTRAMTMRDLLTHQSGLAAPPGLLGGMGESGRTLHNLIDDLANLPLDFQPGSEFSYGVSTDVVGYLVETFSGERFDDYLRRWIFEPLGMADTGFWVPADRSDRLAALYAATRDGLVLMDDPHTSALRIDATYFSGGGGLTTTAQDYGRFACMLRGRGALDGERVIGRKTLELMTTNHLTGGRTIAESTKDPFFGDYHGQGYGLGFGVTADRAGTQMSGSPGEFYWTGAAGTLMFVDPAEDLTVVFLTQALPDVPTRGYRNPYKWHELRAMIYAALD